MATKKFAVIGIGQFGRAIAKALIKRGVEVMAIDSDPEKIDSIADEVTYAVVLDATDKRALLSQSIETFDAVIIAIGKNFEQRLLSAALLLDLNIKRIIARSMGKNQKILLEKIGVKEVLSPEDEVGAIVAERLLNPSIVSYLQLPDDYRIAELKTPKSIANRTLGDINLRDKYQLSLITIKSEINEVINNQLVVEAHIQGVPNSRTVVTQNDNLLLFGKNKDIERFIKINE
jgi:trk system potassium uptake protein